MILKIFKGCFLGLCFLVCACSPNNNQKIEHLSAGDTTVFTTQGSAFSKESANIKDVERLLKFNLGDDFFERPWVSKRASTRSRDGLGPLFNSNACQNCHVRDGRGHAPNVSSTENGRDFSSLLLRASSAKPSVRQRQAMLDGRLANVVDATFGGQLQHRARHSMLSLMQI